MRLRSRPARGWYLLGAVAVIVATAYEVATGHLTTWAWYAEAALFTVGTIYSLILIGLQLSPADLPRWYSWATTMVNIGLAAGILAIAAPTVPAIMPLACVIFSTTTLAAVLSGPETDRLRPFLGVAATLVGLLLVWSQTPAGAAGNIAPLMVWGGLQLGVGILLDVNWRMSRRQLDTRMATLTMLSDIANRLSGSTDMDEVTTAVLEAFASSYPDVNWGGLLIYDVASGALEAQPVSLRPDGVHATEAGGKTMDIQPGEGVAGEAFSRGEIVFRSTALEAGNDRRSRRDATNEGIEKLVGTVMSAIAVPLRSGAGEVIGVVSLGSNRREYNWSDDDLMIAKGIADQAGVAVERGRLYDEQKLQARTDSLTALPNRREFERVLAGHDRELPFTVLAIDLDNLKTINDEYGHEAGDRVVRLVGTTLRAGLRGDDTLARVGGDEFAAFLPGTDLATATEIADRLTWSMQGVAVPSGSARISTGCAAGIAGSDGRQVWSEADEALYRAKASGRNRVEVARHSSSPARRREVRWAEVLPEILSGRQVQAAYQPVVELASARVVGFEALARPTTHDGVLAVDGLFAAALRLGLGRDLDWLCRRAAVQDAHRLPEGSMLFVNVGVPALLDPLHDVDQMLLLLRWARRSPESVVLEITEREAVKDLDRFREVLGSYRNHGFRFAMDDVGEGHSTLEILAAGAPEFIKIASSLTRAASQAGPSAAIQALVTFASSSGAVVVAEGIETRAQLEQMRELGAELGQGHLLGRPALGGVHPTTAAPLRDAVAR